MFTLSFSDKLALVGIICMFVLATLDKAGKLNGPLPLVLLAFAALITLPLALGNSWVSEAPSTMHLVFRGMTMLCTVGLVYSVLVNWILPDTSSSPSKSETSKQATRENAAIPQVYEQPTAPIVSITKVVQTSQKQDLLLKRQILSENIDYLEHEKQEVESLIMSMTIAHHTIITPAFHADGRVEGTPDRVAPLPVVPQVFRQQAVPVYDRVVHLEAALGDRIDSTLAADRLKNLRIKTFKNLQSLAHRLEVFLNFFSRVPQITDLAEIQNDLNMVEPKLREFDMSSTDYYNELKRVLSEYKNQKQKLDTEVLGE